MNNKRLGMSFEKEVCNILRGAGWWVHFISPDVTGAQPFDIIAVKNRAAMAIDCKTSVKPIFSISRLEENQILAFDKWIACGNLEPLVFVKYDGDVYFIPYLKLKSQERVDVRECNIWREELK